MGFENNNLVLTLIVGVLGSGGVLGAFVALIKWRPENDQTSVLVKAAQGAVVVQSSVIDDLHAQLTELRKQVTELKD